MRRVARVDTAGSCARAGERYCRAHERTRPRPERCAGPDQSDRRRHRRATRDLIADWIARAREAGAGLVVFPELCLPGYPAEDLYLKRHFAEANVAALGAPRRATPTGSPPWSASPSRSPRPRSSGAPTARRRARSTTRSRCSPTARRGRLPQEPAAQLRRLRRGPLLRARRRAAGRRGRRRRGRADDLRGPLGAGAAGDRWRPSAGAQLIVNPSGSPYLRGKGARPRADVRRARPRAYGVPIAFCNLVGGQDELVFDGHSFVVDAARRGRRPGAAVRAGPADLGARRPEAARIERAARRPRRGLRRARARAARLRRARTASSGPWSASRAGSTRRWSRWSPPTRSAPSGSPAWSCPPPTPAPRPRPTRARSPRNLGAELIELPIERGDGRLRARSSASTGAAPGSPPRTSRRGSAATC